MWLSATLLMIVSTPMQKKALEAEAARAPLYTQMLALSISLPKIGDRWSGKAPPGLPPRALPSAGLSVQPLTAAALFFYE